MMKGISTKKSKMKNPIVKKKVKIIQFYLEK